MDLTRAIGYRGFPLNSVEIDANQRMQGCEITRVEYPGVPGIGYDEKRALADGFDASDVYLGKRLIGMTGALYGYTRGGFFDLKQALVTALTPTAAYDEDPADKGFMPLDYYEPTANTIDFPAGYIHKMVNARPVRQPSVTIDADKTGGEDGQPLALEWTGLVECRDPRVYFFTPTEVAISGTAASGSGDLVNRGDYPSPLNIMLVTAASTPAGSFHFVGGGADLTFTIPAGASTQILRYSARLKVLSHEIGGVESLRMDLLAMNALKNHPLVPVGTSPYSWSLTSADLVGTSKIFHTDSWA